jgi:DNA integrity scanning protein DisA with diadenylate cyclase activity
MDAENIIAKSIVEAAIDVCRQVRARALFSYADATPQEELLGSLEKAGAKLILIARDAKDATFAKTRTKHVLSVPPVTLTRMGQVKMAVLLAFSQRMLRIGDTFVFLTGVVGDGVDTMVVMKVGSEWEMFQTVDQPHLTEHIRRVVFERVLNISIALANEGREGRPVGALFVIGDDKEVARFCKQMIINPFKGYDESKRNILDDSITETVKEFSAIDGAFVIKGNGVIVSAGTYLRPNLAGEELPYGLGARHSVAAAITASTESVAISVSESTGAVRVWRRGQMITEIEKAVRTPPHSGEHQGMGIS